MSAATIVFFDLVGFSKQPTQAQRDLIDGFNAELVRLLRRYLTPPEGPPEAVALPTGDGVAVALLHRDRRAWTFEHIVELLTAIDTWASTSAHQPQLRVGIHTGAIELITDVNGRTNICGDTINRAQRVMDAADPNQTLVSKEAFGEHFGIRNGDRCAGPFDVVAKHDLHVDVYSLKLPGRWRTAAPASSLRMVVKLTDLPKRIEGPFAGRMQQASAIALVQLTGRHLLQHLRSTPDALSPGLRTFRVFMPHADATATWASPLPARTELIEHIDGWRTFLMSLRAEKGVVDVRLGLFRQPPFFGASFLDWDVPGGQIHVSPYLWGVPARECPGFDLQWLGRTPPRVYSTYQRALNNVAALSEDALGPTPTTASPSTRAP